MLLVIEVYTVYQRFACHITGVWMELMAGLHDGIKQCVRALNHVSLGSEDKGKLLFKTPTQAPSSVPHQQSHNPAH
jgi:hypothetical protein